MNLGDHVPHGGREIPLSFHTFVTDAIKDWEFLLNHNISLYEEEEGRGLPDPNSDEGRTEILRGLMERFFVSFESWCVEEVLVFAIIAYPRQLLAEITHVGRHSLFLAVLYDAWKPSILEWFHLLWEFAGRACELFADILFLLPKDQRPDNARLGKVLFSDMINNGIIHPRTCASFVGALLEYPEESTYARKHEAEIDSLSKNLAPADIGLICRSLVLYRAREDSCNCGYERGEDDCMCQQRYIKNNYEGPRGVQLEGDRHKEYACVIFKLILERHCDSVIDEDMRWSQQQRDTFLQSACELVFSEAVYTELYQNLHGGRRPTLKQQFPRKLTPSEEKSNVMRATDNDYNHSMAQHGGCVERNCKQSMKIGCVNVSCKVHCKRHGTQPCKVHRMYDPVSPPRHPRRKQVRGIAQVDEREQSAYLFRIERESEHI